MQTDTMTFGKWKQELNRLVVGEFGMSLDDLPDMCFRDWYDDDLSIYQALDEVRDSIEEDFGIDLD